ncbi:MAG: hypothetical protein J6V08_03430 [Candidatus Methanomethylophilaceae archaeon]|nr:hypothetical protein [Candidatus Methanomethylophilaceae archaeon]
MFQKIDRPLIDVESYEQRVLCDLDMDDDMFLFTLETDNTGRDPDTIANAMIMDILERFKIEAKEMLDMGRSEDARNILEAIALALKESESALIEWSDGLPGRLAYRIERCIEDGKYREALD